MVGYFLSGILIEQNKKVIYAKLVETKVHFKSVIDVFLTKSGFYSILLIIRFY